MNARSFTQSGFRSRLTATRIRLKRSADTRTEDGTFQNKVLADSPDDPDDVDKPDDLDDSGNADDSDDSLMTFWASCPSSKK